MPRLWPRMAYEAPTGYVLFVERHLDALRREAATVVGDDGEADRLYPDVLMDVATHWKWLEARRRWLGGAGAADAYLHRAFQRRSLRWRSEQWRSDQDAVSEVDVWGPDVQVWRPDEPPPLIRPRTPPGTNLSSTALRLAPHVTPERRASAMPVAEALVAWWHAYEAWRRRQVIVIVATVFILLALASRPGTGAVGAPPERAPVTVIDIHAGWG